MPLAGHALVPRDVSRILYDLGWVNADNHALMLASLLAESNLWTWAWHHNADGTTDWGPCQLNDGNVGGLPPKIVSGMPEPQAGGSGIKSQDDLNEFVKMATDPARCFKRARQMYDDRGFKPWYAGPSYEHPPGTAWKRYYTQATYAMRNMLHERRGFPLA